MNDTKENIQAELFKALIQAQTYAKAVEKKASNTYHGYDYASAEGMIAEARDALSQAGLACFSERWEVREGRMHVYYRIVHGSGGYAMMETSTAILIEKGRPADKAEATALTYNLGYFLRGLLLLPRVAKGTQPDERDDRNHDPMIAIREEYTQLLTQINDEQRKLVESGIKSRGESVTSLTSANKYMARLVAIEKV